MSRPYADYSTEDLLKLKNDKDYMRISAEMAKINAELRQRELESNIQKLTIPHWTRNWTFYLVVLSLIISIAALSLQWRADIRDSKSSHVSSLASAPSTTSNLPPKITPKKQISQSKPVQKKP